MMYQLSTHTLFVVGLNETAIANLFGISSSSTVSSYYVTWLLFLDTFFAQVCARSYEQTHDTNCTR